MQNVIGTSPLRELEIQLVKYLSDQGYQVTEQVKIRGKSGIEHTFNLLARLDDGFANYVIAFVFNSDKTPENQLNAVFSFGNKAYDAGIRDRVLITGTDFSKEARDFAQKQNIRVLDADRLEQILEQKPTCPIPPEKTPVPGTRRELVQALTSLAYRVEEKARIKGRSGADYTFDILAYNECLMVPHSLAIEVAEETSPVGLGRISLFDTKAYDVGIDHKAFFSVTELTPEAEQFAELQGIRVIQAPPPAILPAAKRSEKPPENGKPAVETRPLRQRIESDAIQLIPEVMARRYNAIPVSISGNTLQVAMADPSDIFAIEAFAAQSRKRIRPFAAPSEEVRQSIDFNYKATGEIEEHLANVSISNETSDDKLAVGAAVDAPLAQALNLIIEEAAKARASDIHIEPEENRLRIRYRIDGTLHETMSLPMNIHRALISRIKILAQMNIADHFHPQDGQFSMETKGRSLDIRVATAPVIHGETAVLRLLDKSIAMRELGTLGMMPDSLEGYKKLLKYPYGMILVSGPTGSGKTTTLYASINSLDTVSKNIVTIEDPAEYRFKDINQIQVNVLAGITFASGLRSILRLDPNIILVGEIRDGETANIATQAALTGHLVLSSIHANDSTGCLSRLADLGTEMFLVASSVIGVVAQRMVRRICPDCGHAMEVPVPERLAYEQVMGEKITEARYGMGCASCSYTGYLGRIGLFEVFTINDNLRTLMMKGAAKHELRAQALKDGLVPMIKDGMLKVKNGVTTISEVLSATYSQD